MEKMRNTATSVEVFPRGNRIFAFTVIPRVRVSFPLGSIPVKTTQQEGGTLAVKLAKG